MAKINLSPTSLNHVPESYTLSEWTNKQEYEATFCME